MVKIGRTKKKGRPPKSDPVDRRVGLGQSDSRTAPRREPDLRRSTRRRSITYVEDFYDDLFDDEEDEDNDEEDEDEDEGRREKKVKLVTKIAGNNNKKQPSYKRVDSVNRIGSGCGGRRRSVDRKSVDRKSAERISSASASAPESSSEYGDDNKPFKKRKIEEDDGDGDFSEQDNDDRGVDDDENEDDSDERSVRSRDQKKNSKPNGVSKRLDSVPPQGKPSVSSKGVPSLDRVIAPDKVPLPDRVSVSDRIALPDRVTIPDKVPLPDKQQLELILDKLQKKDTYGVYAEPVDPDELPDYHDVIEHPMDFGTVRKKLANGSYSNLGQLENDVDLICTNAMHYNAPETIYFKQARSIQELARKKFENLRSEIRSTVVEHKSEETIKTNSIIKKPIKKPSCKTIQEPVGSEVSAGATLTTAGDLGTLLNATQAAGSEKPSTVDGQADGNSSLTESKPEKTEEQISGKAVPQKLGRKLFVIDENRRATYNISSQPLVDIESMCTIFEPEKMHLIPVGLNSDNSYPRSLARFAASLGPIAWKVASRKIEQALPPGTKFGRGWIGEYEPLPTPVLMIQNRAPKQPQPRPGIISTMSSKDDKSKVRESDPMVSKNDIQLALKTKEMGLFGISGSKSNINTTYQQRNVGSEDILVKKVESPNGVVGRLPNGKVGNASNHHLPRAGMYFPHQEQGLTDPVQLMRMLAEKSQNQVEPSTRRDESCTNTSTSGAASAAARAWMTLGAGIPPKAVVSRVQPPQQVFLPQVNRPQMEMDLSRFQGSSPWQGLRPHGQGNLKKQESNLSFPPDLNISFQASSTSASMVDSQQPDLALQL